jgi:hypothetical protein
MTLAFRAILFDAVWHRECYPISRIEFRGDMNYEARITHKGDLAMYRKMFTGVVGLILLGTFFVPKGRADEMDKRTIVTVNQPIQVPGKVLPAGTYVFKLPDVNNLTLVSIFNADETQLITTVRGIPDSQESPSAKTTLQFEEGPAGQPEALKAWFYPGESYGVEFEYPTQEE